MYQDQNLLLKLLRTALFDEKLDASAFAEADWKQIFHLADVETVPSLVLDGMAMLPSSALKLSLDEKLVRFGKMQKMECMNSLHRSVIEILWWLLRISSGRWL